MTLINATLYDEFWLIGTDKKQKIKNEIKQKCNYKSH